VLGTVVAVGRQRDGAHLPGTGGGLVRTVIQA